ncbi:MAG: hypothetical protein K5694_00015 [Bacilli bacterium]|nr:hypothetical protein [Bacilli bacterium]
MAFEENRIIKTTNGDPIRIGKLIGSGGQGDVYIVDFKGQKKALKWYRKFAVDKDKFRKNLIENVRRGRPDPAFLWPEAVTEEVDGSYGYIMDLRPEGYHELSQIILGKVNFPSFKPMVEAAIHIVNAFRIIHGIGYSYQDLNDGGFFVNPKNGDLLICDCDNVSGNNTDLGIIGKPRYMAPEIVKGQARPNLLTDRFSMAIILFLLLLHTHPLEGQKWIDYPQEERFTRKLYGEEACFIFDPTDNSNQATKISSANALKYWPQLPQYLKDIFLKSFSKEAISTPTKRPADVEFVRVLTRFRSDIVTCLTPKCGHELFIRGTNDTECPYCKKTFDVRTIFRLAEYPVVAAKGSKIFRCQLGVCNAKDALDPVVRVAQKTNPDGTVKLMIQNISGGNLNCVDTKGQSRVVPHEGLIPLKKGIKISAYGHDFMIDDIG